MAESALTALDDQGLLAGETTAVIQGFGSMGGATARYLAQAGVRVVGIVDSQGMVVDPDGLDVEALLASRSPSGVLDRSRLGANGRLLPAGAWLDVDCDILVPASISYCITAADEPRVRARFVVEAANMPVLPDAEARLLARGVTIVPDFVANSATNAWWWWTLFGDIDADPQQAEKKVRDSIRSIVSGVLSDSRARGISPRDAAQALVDRNLAEITARLGDSDRR